MQLLLKQDSTNSNLQNAILSFYLRIGMAAGRRMDIVLDDHKSWGKQGKKKELLYSVDENGGNGPADISLYKHILVFYFNGGLS